MKPMIRYYPGCLEDNGSTYSDNPVDLTEEKLNGILTRLKGFIPEKRLFLVGSQVEDAIINYSPLKIVYLHRGFKLYGVYFLSSKYVGTDKIIEVVDENLKEDLIEFIEKGSMVHSWIRKKFL